MLLIAVLSIASLQAVRAQCTATITALGPTTFCAPGSVTLKASPGNVYRWYKNGNYIALLVCDTFTVHTSGSYSVVVDAGGLLDGRDVLPPIIPPPVTPPSCCATATPVHVHINRTANGRARRGRGVDINSLPVF